MKRLSLCAEDVCCVRGKRVLLPPGHSAVVWFEAGMRARNTKLVHTIR